MKTWISSFALFLLLPVVLLFSAYFRQEPKYQGKTASRWFQIMQMPPTGADTDAGLKALLAIGSPAVPVLERELRSPLDGMRFKACWVLAQMGQSASNAVPKLIVALDDPEIAVQIGATEALASIGQINTDLLPQLLPRLSHTNLSLSAVTAKLLNRIWDDSRTKSQQPDSVNYETAMALVKSSAPSARVAVLPMLLAFSQSGTNVNAAFQSLLNDADGWVREETVKFLVRRELPEKKLIPSTASANFITSNYK